jgi:hypothetical protein
LPDARTSRRSFAKAFCKVQLSRRRDSEISVGRIPQRKIAAPYLTIIQLSTRHASVDALANERPPPATDSCRSALAVPDCAPVREPRR